MIRVLTPQPSPMNLGLLREEALAAWSDMRDLNLVETDTAKMVAVYFDDGKAPSQADIDALIAAHDGTKQSTSEQRQADQDSARERLKALDASSFSVGFGPMFHDLLRALGIRED